MRYPEGPPKPDAFYSVVARMVQSVSENHPQLRAMIYEFVRIKFHQDLYASVAELGWVETAKRVLALETAIERVETDFAAGTSLPAQTPDVALEETANEDKSDHSAFIAAPEPGPEFCEPTSDQGQLTEPEVMPVVEPEIMPIAEPELMPALYDPTILPSFLKVVPHRRVSLPVIKHITELDGTELEITELNSNARTDPRYKLVHGGLWWTVQLILAVIFAVAIYAAISGRFLQPTQIPAATRGSESVLNSPNGNVSSEKLGESTDKASTTTTGAAKVSAIPVPTVYGAFVVNGGHLVELGLLPIPVPDSRIAISAPISTPSRAHVPDGHVEFIIYRRDLVSSVPDHVTLRVVAQIVRSLTFEPSGKAKTTNVENAWVVRSGSYEMAAGPIAGNPDMISIKPADPTTVLPAGRYALVLKHEAYDVTVDGPITDPAHCLERTEAVNFPVYTECKTP